MKEMRNWQLSAIAMGMTFVLVSCVWAPANSDRSKNISVSPVTNASDHINRIPVLDEMTQTQVARAKRLDALMPMLVAKGAVPGISITVIEGGKQSYFGMHGWQQAEERVPLSRDTIARYYSMTKPIVAVALLQLWEQGKFKLDDPVGMYLPELSGLQVFAGVNEDGSMRLVPAKRAVTVRDLLLHTSGMTYGFFTQTPVDKAYQAAGVLSYEDSNEELVSKLSKLPLLAQPGEKWIYSVSVDVQGRLIEVLSNQSLGDYLQAHVFAPLGMVDTGFSIPIKDHDRFAAGYQLGKNGLEHISDEKGNSPLPVDAPFLHGSNFESGGGGLVSTIDDYAQFANALLGSGAPLLQPATIELMRKDHLGEADRGWLGSDTGFGLGVSVKLTEALPGKTQLPVGSYGWGGLAGTYFWVDPASDLTAVMQIQVMNADAANVRDLMVAAVYGVPLNDQLETAIQD